MAVGQLPHQGEFHHSPNKKFKEVVVFVHHFGGNKRTTKRQQKLVMELGFDCVAFNLYQNSDLKLITGLERLKRLVHHLVSLNNSYVTTWTQELNEMLDAVPGEKMIYSLSSPSTSVVGVVGKKQRKDVKAWICDGGPFLDIWDCFRNYAVMDTQTKNPLVSFTYTSIGFLFFGGLGYPEQMKKWLEDFPTQLPILSFRALHDQLVPKVAIEKFFALQPQLHLKAVEVNSGHLEGIKSDAELYKSSVKDFLTKHATSII